MIIKTRDAIIAAVVTAMILAVSVPTITGKFAEARSKIETAVSAKTEAEKSLRQLERKVDDHDLVPKGSKRTGLISDITAYINARHPQMPDSVVEDVALQVVDVSAMESVSPLLVLGITEVESHFNPMARSKVDARGLMQVMPEWVGKLDGLESVNDLHNIDTGIRYGIRVLKIQLDENGGNLDRALYDYSGKSRTYSMKIYTAMGKLAAFRWSKKQSK